jgi:hypothetical protein
MKMRVKVVGFVSTFGCTVPVNQACDPPAEAQNRVGVGPRGVRARHIGPMSSRSVAFSK